MTGANLLAIAGQQVAPLAGARIEIAPAMRHSSIHPDVAPLAGARIEMTGQRRRTSRSATSLPSRERGLK